MTIASEIQRIQTNIANAYDALEAKGATMPATENTDNLVTTIDTISGGVITATNITGSAIKAGDKVWIEKITSGGVTTYAINDFYKTLEQNYKVNGHIYKFPNGAYGSFSEYNYFTLDKNISIASTFEAIIKFTSPTSDISSFQNILDFDPLTELYIENSELRVYASIPDSSVSCGSISTSTVYWAKIVKENGTTKLSYSTDGETFIGEVSISGDTETEIYNKKIGAGIYYNRSFKGEIFLEESYIKIDGTMYEYSSSDALTGFAQENIASGSTGDVLTLLPPEPESKKKRLVSVASNSDISAYSDDNGISWTETSLPNSKDYKKICYGNGRYIILINSTNEPNKCFYSIDGINWDIMFLPLITYTSGTSTYECTYSDIIYENGKFVATSSGYKIAISDDGINWNTVDMETRIWDKICYGNGIFLITGSKKVAISEDGITWTEYNPQIYFNSIAYGNGVFVTKWGKKLYHSSDGINWTEGIYPSDVPTGGSIYFCNNTFILIHPGNTNVGYYTLISSDGINWTKPTETLEYLAITTGGNESNDGYYKLSAVTNIENGLVGLSENGLYRFTCGSDGNWVAIANQPPLYHQKTNSTHSAWNIICVGEVD